MLSFFRSAAGALGLAALLGSGCIEDEEPAGPFIPGLTPATPISTESQNGAALAGARDASVQDVPSHLPCDVDSLLKTRCRNCHSAPRLPNHPTPLMTYAELLQPSTSAPGLTYAQQAQQMIQTGMMPPSGGLTATDVATFNAWLAQGAPPGECTTFAVQPDAGFGLQPDAGLNLPDASFLDAQPGVGAQAGRGRPLPP
jgi:hypothetical protein